MDIAQDLTRHENLPLQVAHRLREAIKLRLLNPGDQLPTESQLQDTYNVSRNTARQAISILVTEGLVRIERGVGTFVQSPPLRLSFNRFSRANRRSGVGPYESALAQQDIPGYTEIVLVERKPASIDVANGLEIPEGTEVICRRRYHHAGDPDMIIQIQEGYLIAEMVEGSDLANINVLPEGTYPVLERLGHIPSYVTDTLSARPATEFESEVMGLRVGVQVIHATRKTWNQENVPIQWATTVAAADRNIFVYDRLPIT